MQENQSLQPPISTTTTNDSASKNELKVRVDATLPTLQAESLKPGVVLEGEITGLRRGVYGQQPVTIQQVPSQILTEHRESLAAFAQLASPFWLPVIGICEGVSEGSWVTASLPSTSFKTYLSSSAAESWMNRCRLARDVAVGVYQRLALGATHIAWDTRQLYLDQEGRAQLFPLIREKAVEESEDVFFLGQLLWQVASRSTVLVEGWQKGKGLPQDCPPEVLALIQTCTDPVISARPSLKSLAKGLDAFWQQMGSRLLDPLSSIPTTISHDEKEKKYKPSSTQPLASTISFTQTSGSSGGLLSILLVDDQMVSWLSVEDPRYSVGVKLCALRDHSTIQLAESKTSMLSGEIQRTLLNSSVEMLLWLSEDGVDPSVLLADSAECLWQAPAWRTYRPGDPPLITWLPLRVNIQSTPLFTHSHQPPTETADFTEAEWRELHSQYALCWLVKGADTLTSPCNLYEANELYQAVGRTRLVLHIESSTAYKLEESTYLMPHDAQGHLLSMRYARLITNPAFEISTWEGRYQGVIGGKALKTSPPQVIVMPAPDLGVSPEDCERFCQEKEIADIKSIVGTGTSGQVVRSTYGGHTVAVKHFKEAKLSTHDKAHLKKEAAIMAKLHSDFLVRVWGLSLAPPLLVMELLPHSLIKLLTDSSCKLPWSWRYRLLRDAALGLAILHQHELLHRDLKSANILVDADGRAKLCDFGISILNSSAEQVELNGTPSHIAPEVMRGAIPSTMTDVYSFGVVCWEVALRREADHVFLSKVASDIQKGLRDILSSDCPPPLVDVIYACCAEAPKQRPDIHAVAQVLEGLWQAAIVSEQNPLLREEKSKVPPKPADSETLALTSKTVDQHDKKSTLSQQKRSKISFFKKLIPWKKKLPTLPTTTSPVIPPNFLHTSNLKTLLATRSPPCWQDRLSPQYTVGVKLQRLRQAVLADFYITQELSCYIAPNGQSQPGQPSNPLYPWVERELLQGNAQVLVLQGVAGAGKSTFNRHLLCRLWQDPAWQAYRPGDPAPKAPMPVWIPLGSGQVHPSDLWDYYRHLPEIGFTTAEIAVLKKNYSLVWLADGYDEIPGQTAPNLYDLNQLGKYQVKLVIGCRSQRLQTLSEVDALVPHPTGASPDWSRYRTRHVAPFTPAQTQDYIDKYVAQHRNDPDRPKDWDVARYKKEFAAFPELQTFIDTPFMLWMALSILPGLASEQTPSPEKNKQKLKEKKDHDKKDVKESKQSSVSRPKITRAALYDSFMDAWFTRQARKAWQARSYLKDPAVILGKPTMQAIKEQASQMGGEDVQVHWLKHAYRTFCYTFAQQLTQAGQISARYEKDKEVKEKNSSWEPLLGNTMPDSTRLRQGCPLRESSDHTWSFIHASLLDYFLTTAVAEALLLPADVTTSTENMPFALTHAQAALLGRAHLTPEQIRFFADRVEGNSPLQEALFALIERSKTDVTVAIASANAATVLNACGINLSYQDWQNVQLPGADLRYAQLAYTNLQAANLRGTTLMRAILYRANLQAADLREVRWGEWPQLQLEKHVLAVVQHPTQPWLAVGEGRNIVLLHTETGARIGLPLTGHTETVNSVSFNPDGRQLVSGSGDRTLRLWDVETQKALGAPLKGHTKEVSSVSFSPDGRRVVSGSKDNILRLWDVETQQAMGAPLVGHTRDVMSVSFSPDGRRVVSGSRDDTLRLWDVGTQQAIGAPLVGHTAEVYSVSFSPDGRRVVSGGADATLRLWDVETQQALGTPLAGHMHYVMSVSFSPDGRQIVSGSWDQTVRLWDVETQQAAMGAPLAGHMRYVMSVSFSPDGRRIVSGSYDKTVRLWDVETQQTAVAPLTGHTDRVRSVSFSPDGRRVVSGSRDDTLRLWDVETQQALGEPLRGHTDVVSVSFSPDGRRVASGSWDKTLRLWDVDTQQALGAPLEGHTDGVRSVAFSPDGRRVVSGSADATLRLWDMETQQAVGKPLTAQGDVNSVSFSPDGRRVVSGSGGFRKDKKGNTVRLWDVETQQALGEPLTGHTSYVQSVSFSPDGRRVASGSWDKTLRLWDVEMRKAIGAPLEGHTEYVTSVSFSPDGRRVVSGSRDQTVRLWDIESHQCVAVMHWHQAIEILAIIHPKTSFTTRDDLDSQSSRGLTSTMSAEEDLLAMGDEAGTISFWAVSRKDPAIRFLGMPRHSAMPLLVDGIALQGCRMDASSKRLLEQYRADVSKVEVADEKRVMGVPTSTTAFDPENEEPRSLSSLQIPDQKRSNPPSQPLHASLSPIQGSLPFTLLPPPQLYLEAQRLVSTVATELEKDKTTRWDKNAAASYAAMVMAGIRENQLSAMLAAPKDYGFLLQLIAGVRRHLTQYPQLTIAIQADMASCKVLETQLLLTGALESKTTIGTHQFSSLHG